MNTLDLYELNEIARVDKLIVHSLERMIYQVSIELNNETHWLVDSSGQPARFQHTEQIRKLFQDIELVSAVMHLPTTFDEMIGRPALEHAVACEIPLGWRH
ncbi:MAG: DUF6482 family protein [Amphritea sp.]|nr:DUF6482 family protein [Amphritea sp.]